MTGENRIAIVAGAANSVGRAAALELAASGVGVVLFDDDRESLEKIRKEILSVGSSAWVYSCDFGSVEGVKEIFAGISVDCGPIQVLVNNLGQEVASGDTEFLRSGPEHWDSMIDTTLKATLLCCQQVLEGMREQRSGRIINLLSETAIMGGKNAAAFAAAHAGIVGFTRSLARELAPYHVTVNAIAQGCIQTPAVGEAAPDVIQQTIDEIPMGFIAEPEDIAHAIAFFASDDSRYITGQTLLVNGGRWMN